MFVSCFITTLQETSHSLVGPVRFQDMHTKPSIDEHLASAPRKETDPTITHIGDGRGMIHRVKPKTIGQKKP
jgi:hypothetical protein